MKKIALLFILAFSVLFFSCKNPEINVQVNARFSEAFVSKFLEVSHTDEGDGFDNSFFAIMGEKSMEIIRSLGSAECFFNIDLSTVMSGFSIKKVYAKKNTVATGHAVFEKPLSQDAISYYHDFKAQKSSPAELNFSDDKKRIDFTYVCWDEIVFFSSGDKGEVDASEVMKTKNEKVKFKIRLRGTKIVISPAQKIDGLDMEIVISRI